jgi:CubicO group peptidase (beta-lactamase class C family)
VSRRFRRASMLSIRAAILLGLVAMHAGAADEPDDPAPRFDFGAAIETGESLPRLHSLLVSFEGTRVLERYFNGHDRFDTANVKSVSKSVISALVGIAIERGDVGGVGEPISDYFDKTRPGEPLASRGRITIGNLLSMQSGLETTSNRNYGAWVLSPNWVDAALEQPFVRPPGTTMIYSTGNTHLLSAILTRATGRSTLQFARDALTEPLGFELATWPRDPQGICFGGNDRDWTPRQMLAFGQLYLDGGRAGGRQVVPADWIEASLRFRTQSTRERGRYYGYGWWMRDMAGYWSAYAWGYGGQFIVLVPELDLVVVTTSSSAPGTGRRSHTRAVYDLVEHRVIAPSGRAIEATRAAPRLSQTRSQIDGG